VEKGADASGTLAGLARCGSCGSETVLRADRIAPGGGLLGCLACGHAELYTRKGFPTAVGIGIVVVAAVLAPVTMYASLVAAAGIDFALYHLVRDVVVCYACGAEHRGFPPEPRHPRFDREIEERLKFGERAVMGRPMRAGGTAGAPDPEH
jgi:hypothetical protein